MEKHLPSGDKVNAAFNVGLLSAEMETRLIKAELKLKCVWFLLVLGSACCLLSQ